MFNKGVFLFFACLSFTSFSQCVKPITNESKISQWDDIRNIQVDGRINKNIKFVQTISGTGVRELNLDYYSIVIDKPNDIDAFWNKFRLSFNDLIFEDGKIETLYGSFQTYAKSDIEKWESDNPIGALMSFTMLGVGKIYREGGSVVLSCYSKNQWVFSTVTTDKDGFHPVSGNRAFGYIDNADGSITIYTKAADRLTEPEAWKELFGGELTMRPSTLFFGDQIWKTFLEGIEKKYKHLNPRNKNNGIIKTVPYGDETDNSIFRNLKDNIKFLIPSEYKPVENDFLAGIEDYPQAEMYYQENLTGTSIEQNIASAKQKGDTEKTGYYSGMLWAHEYKNGLRNNLNYYVDDLNFPHNLKDQYDLSAISNACFSNTIQQQLDFNSDSELLLNLFQSRSVLDKTSPALFQQKIIKNLLSANNLLEQLIDHSEDQIIENVQQEIERFKEVLIETGLNNLSQENDIPQGMTQAILSLNDLINKKISWEEFEQQMYDNIHQYIYWYARVTGYCICTPPKCSTFEAICTGYYYYNFIKDWDGSLKDVSGLLKALYPELETYGAIENYEYYQELQAYYDKIKLALELYEKSERIKSIIDAFERVSENLNEIQQLNLNNSLEIDIQARVSRYTDLLNQLPQDKKAILSFRASEPNQLSVLLDLHRLEKLSYDLVSDVSLIDLELSSILGAEEFMSGLIDAITVFAKILTTELTPIVNDFERSLRQIDIRTYNMLIALYSLSNDLDIEGKMIMDGINRAAMEYATVKLIESNTTQEIIPFSINSVEVITPLVLDDSIYSPNYSNLLSKMESLYKFQSYSNIRKRFNETKSSFFYFRQFPPYFYDKLNHKLRLNNHYSSFEGLSKNYRGWVMGDVHPQNFGTIMPLDNSGQLKLVMNDPDDGGEGSLFMDFTRFVVGTELLSKSIYQNNYDQLIQAYIDGLRLKDRPISKETSRLLESKDFYENRLIKSTKIREGNFRKDKYLVPVQFTEPLDSMDLVVAEKEIRIFFHKKAQIEDSYKYKRLKGGSGGNGRWEVLVSLDLKNINGHSLGKNYYWIEFKMLGLIPGNYPSSHTDYEKIEINGDLVQYAKNRYRSNILVGQGLNALPLYKFVETNDGPAMMRYRYEGNLFYPVNELKYYNQDALLDVLKDQSYLLGKIQNSGYSIWNSDDSSEVRFSEYISKIENLDKKAFTGLIDEIRFEMKSDFLEIDSRDRSLLQDIYKIVSLTNNERRELENLVINEYEDPHFNDQARLSFFIKERFNEDEEIFTNIKDLIVAIFKRESANNVESNLEIDDPNKIGIYEINFRPKDVTYIETTKGWKKKDFEYIILVNISNDTISFGNLQFNKGIKHDFPDDLVVPKGELLLLARNVEAVKYRYDFEDLQMSYEGNFDSGYLNRSDVLELHNYKQDRFGRVVEEKLIDLSYDWSDNAIARSVFNMEIRTTINEIASIPKWQIISRKTKYAMIDRLIPIALNYKAIGGDLNDFFILQNSSDLPLDTRNLSLIGEVDRNLQTILKPREILLLCQDTVKFKVQYNLSNKYKLRQYSGRLGNKKGTIRLTSIVGNDSLTLWKLKYRKNWFSGANGNGKMIVPNNVCDDLKLLEDKTGWKEETYNTNLSISNSICISLAKINLCGERYKGDQWEETSEDGTIRQYECINIDSILIPVQIQN
ncbi:DUF2252 family protein [Dokdonia sp.]|uniref:DUF2252 family protein n=1 Tax=Dokdonia sp. TaxID=2024995 RepID=UPI003267B973